jgi:hypothetical protein
MYSSLLRLCLDHFGDVVRIISASNEHPTELVYGSFPRLEIAQN